MYTASHSKRIATSQAASNPTRSATCSSAIRSAGGNTRARAIAGAAFVASIIATSAPLVGDRRYFDQGSGPYKSALDAITRRFLAWKVFGIDLVDGAVVRPIGDEDVVERNIGEAGPRSFQDALDRFHDMARLRCRVAFVNNVVVLVEGERARHVNCIAG